MNENAYKTNFEYLMTHEGPLRHREALTIIVLLIHAVIQPIFALIWLKNDLFGIPSITFTKNKICLKKNNTLRRLNLNRYFV